MDGGTKRRRNGKPASCEPCRKAKLRCDHALPACTRCQQRRVANQCFYHPAPLTRTRAEQESSPSTGEEAASDSTSSRPPQLSHHGFGPPEREPSDVQPLAFQSLATDQSLQPSYLGPASFVPEPIEEGILPSASMDRHLRQNGQTTDKVRALPQYWVLQAKDVVRNLTELATVEQLIREFYSVSQSAVIAGPLVLNALAAIKPAQDDISSTSNVDERISRWTALILQNTTQDFPSMFPAQGPQLHKLFTGEHLRLEIIGVILAIAGRASFFGLAQDRFPGDSSLVDRAKFAQTMFAASDTVLQITKILAPVNDLTMWLLNESLLLSCVIHDDSSPTTWHRLGELSTGIFEFGLHRESQQPGDVPLYLRESRRRLFAAAYQLDKSITTFLGRPPRISWRHSDSRLPLDISDEALVAGPSASRSSWIRLRFLISTFREILEVSLQQPSQERVDQLRDISQRCHDAWRLLPDHLKYSPDCWDMNLSAGVYSMLIASYLAYLYNDFLAQRLLVQQSPESTEQLLTVSSTILATVLALGSHRAHVVDLHRDFMQMVLLYGVSSASVLINALQQQGRTGQPLPYRESRASLIRQLSVFISHVESMVRPGDLKYALFSTAAQALSSGIDEILESLQPAPSDASLDLNIDVTNSVMDSAGPVITDEFNLLAMPEFEGLDQWLL